jgi:hypothetical protein
MCARLSGCGKQELLSDGSGRRRDIGTLGTRLFGGPDRRVVSVNCRRQISHNQTSGEIGLPTSTERRHTAKWRDAQLQTLAPNGTAPLQRSRTPWHANF